MPRPAMRTQRARRTRRLHRPLRTLPEDAQVRHLGMAAPVKHPELGDQRLVNQPIKANRTPGGVRTASPDKGAHTEAVLAEFGLGT